LILFTALAAPLQANNVVSLQAYFAKVRWQKGNGAIEDHSERGSMWLVWGAAEGEGVPSDTDARADSPSLLDGQFETLLASLDQRRIRAFGDLDGGMLEEDGHILDRDAASSSTENVSRNR
jgi:hypothetical protein